MREYDDDGNIQHYAPVLRRIIILVAVITAVPVMLWTITAFMHTYIAQPTISAPRPLATATVAPVSPAADTATANPSAPSQPAPAVTDAGATDDGRGDRMRDSAGNNSAPNIQVASTAAISPTPPAAPSAPAAVTVQAAPPAAPSVFPNPPFVTQPQSTPSDAENNAATDDLPPPDPITGPVPLPRHRPSVIALADTDIPLPRARPGDAPEPPSVTPDAPPSGYDPGIGH
jgi:translation initiation factor IF-2